MTMEKPIIGVEEDDTLRDERRDRIDTLPARSDEAYARDASYDDEAHESDASYLERRASDEAGKRWERVQSEFVDDPRRSVADAHELVSDLVQEIVQRFGRERDSLERQWSQGQDVSTEDLRICLQRYRDFFARLLPSAGRSRADGRI